MSTTQFVNASHLSTQLQSAQHPPAGWNKWLSNRGMDGFHLRTEWSRILATSLRHHPWFLWTEQQGEITGVLPLMLIRGPLFGSFLVSQPYLNTGGVLADSQESESMLISRAVQLADSLGVKRLELRHERRIVHSDLNAESTEKVHMRMQLPESVEDLWQGLKSKVRSQIRKPLDDDSLTVSFGRFSELDAFYSVFCRNMRDLGTPVFSRSLFENILQSFVDEAEICTVRFGAKAIASGLLLHGPGTTLIPSASSLREFNATSCNMLMYWHALARSVERGQQWFDFGRSSLDSGTHRFKKQFGCLEYPAVWLYFNRLGQANEMRPGSGRFDQVIRLWKKLPVCVTRMIGPAIVRGIP